MLKPGMIGMSSSSNGILPKLVKFFTNSKYSHTFIITDSIEEVETVQEADLLISLVPFDKYYRQDQTESYWIYEINSNMVTTEQIHAALKKCYEEFAGTNYGILQLLWFPYRWLNEKLGRDVRKEHNWMSKGVICSEFVYWFLFYLGEPFQELLKNWNPDTIQPADIAKILLDNPKIFTLNEVKDLTVNN